MPVYQRRVRQYRSNKRRIRIRIRNDGHFDKRLRTALGNNNANHIVHCIQRIDRYAETSYEIAHGCAARANIQHRLHTLADTHAEQQIASDSCEGNDLRRNDIIVKSCQLHLIGFSDNRVPISILAYKQRIPFLFHNGAENRIAAARNGGLFRRSSANDCAHIAGVQRTVCRRIDAVFIAVRIKTDKTVFRGRISGRPAFNFLSWSFSTLYNSESV